MEKVFYSSLGLDEKIPPSVFETEGGVVAYKFENGVISHCELYFGKKLSYVVYMSNWPSENIVSQHVLKYPECKFEIKNCSSDSGSNVKRYVCLPDGNLEFFIEEILNQAGDIVRENRYDDKGSFLGALEYEYNTSGDLALTREIASNGDIVSENEEEK